MSFALQKSVDIGSVACRYLSFGNFVHGQSKKINSDPIPHIVRSIWMNQRKPPINKEVSAVFRGPKKVDSNNS